jgi:hypothetical protein
VPLKIRRLSPARRVISNTDYVRRLVWRERPQLAVFQKRPHADRPEGRALYPATVASALKLTGSGLRRLKISETSLPEVTTRGVLRTHQEYGRRQCPPFTRVAKALPGHSAAGAAAADTGTAAPHTNGRNVSDLPPDFEAHLASLLALAERHALSEELIVGLRACVPTYEPFDWSQVGSFPGTTARTPGIEPPCAATPIDAAHA